MDEYFSKLSKLFTEDLCNLLYVNYTSILKKAVLLPMLSVVCWETNK